MKIPCMAWKKSSGTKPVRNPAEKALSSSLYPRFSCCLPLLRLIPPDPSMPLRASADCSAGIDTLRVDRHPARPRIPASFRSEKASDFRAAAFFQDQAVRAALFIGPENRIRSLRDTSDMKQPDIFIHGTAGSFGRAGAAISPLRTLFPA